MEKLTREQIENILINWQKKKTKKMSKEYFKHIQNYQILDISQLAKVHDINGSRNYINSTFTDFYMRKMCWYAIRGFEYIGKYNDELRKEKAI